MCTYSVAIVGHH